MSHEKTEEKGYVLDTNNQALLNTDRVALKLHRQKIKQMKESQEALNEINTINTRVDRLNDDVREIKELLLQLIGK